jgi:PAS domain S-box-containing protein
MDNIYQQYFESMPCFLTVQDRDFKIVDANDLFVNNFGDRKGHYCYHVYKNRPEKCEDCPVERTFLDGQVHRSEELVTTRDGKELWVIVFSTPIRDENGEIVKVMEMSADVTKIKLLQRQLRESQDRYRLLFEEVPCFISMQDKDLRIVEANRLHREAFGTTYGSKCYKVYKHREKECMPCIVRQTFEDGEIRMHEEVVTSQAKERMNVIVCTAPIRDANGDIERVIEMSTDITQIRQLQDKLTSVGLLIGSISHGIKGLLNGLDGGIYLVNSGLEKDDRGRIDKGWEIALRNVDRIRSMVMDILYYAKDRDPDWETINADEMGREICCMLTEKAGKINIGLECKVNGSIGEFEADKQAVRSLLINLIENSLDACRIDKQKEEHDIAMEISGDKDTVTFKVSDNGIGMDRETREKAFSLFFSSKGSGGTGLGLFIANKIAKSHGGKIKIESEPGKGSSFVLTLPRKRAYITMAETQTASDVDVGPEPTGS